MEAGVHSNLTGIAIVALAALGGGLVMERLRQPAIVGYILAGVLLGPSGLALVENRDHIDVLAELGVLMLLFVVGMELSLRSFRRLWRLALFATVFQIAASTVVMLLLSRLFGWSVGLSVLLGFVVALSSTAVAIKILENLGELRTRAGRIAVGVLIAQDFAVVPMMLGVAAMGGGGFDWLAVPKIAFSIAFLVGLILYLSRGTKVELPFGRIVAGHADLKPLAALAFCFGFASVSGLLGLSAAYGAFLAGLVIGNSTERHAMIQATQPIQSILMMIFFLSIGLLMDLGFIWDNIGTVLLLFFLVAVFKTALNVGLLGLMGQAWQHAFLAGIMLAQIGEFSFLLSVVGVDAGVISRAESRLVIAVTVLSLALSPLWVFTGRRLRLLAEYGVTEGGEMLRLVYGPEAELVADTFGEARTRTQREVRRTALWLRRQRLKRKRAKAAAAEIQSTATPPPVAEPPRPTEATPEVLAPLPETAPAAGGTEAPESAAPSPEPKAAPESTAKPKPKSGRRRRRRKQPNAKPKAGRGGGKRGGDA